MAHIIFTGNIGKTPELRHTQDGRPWVSFNVAWSERQKTNNGNWENGPTEWVNVIANGTLAENIAASLTKGITVDVTGTIRPEEWQSQHGPQRQLKVIAETVSPNLRFQTATTQRPQRHSPAPQGDVWGQQQAVQDEQPPF